MSLPFPEYQSYFWLNVLAIIFPFLLSFDKKVAYYKSWIPLFKAISVTGLFFIVWDVLKTYYGIWSFNSKYLIGVNIINLPLEEWLFFITVPYSCVFIYECLKAYFPSFNIAKVQTFNYLVAAILLLVAFVFVGKVYTFVNSLIASLVIFVAAKFNSVKVSSFFWLAYLLHLIPFLLVNGVLTSYPIVEYNDAENLGIRFSHITGINFINIPIEDSVYSLTLLLMNVTLFEYFKEH